MKTFGLVLFSLAVVSLSFCAASASERVCAHCGKRFDHVLSNTCRTCRGHLCPVCKERMVGGKVCPTTIKTPA